MKSIDFCHPFIYNNNANGDVAQLGERVDRTHEVVGSNPIISIFTFGSNNYRKVISVTRRNHLAGINHKIWGDILSKGDSTMIKKAVIYLGIIVLLFLFSIPAVAEDDAPDILAVEAIGPLKSGMKKDEVIKALGNPESKSKIQWMGATGLAYQDWNYPKQGITVTMSAEPLEDDPEKMSDPALVLTENQVGEFSLDSIYIKSPCKLKTRKGIGIGSSRVEFEKAYPKNTWDEHFSSEKSVIVGSIYGGLALDFEGDKVVRIRLGAFAE